MHVPLDNKTDTGQRGQLPHILVVVGHRNKDVNVGAPLAGGTSNDGCGRVGIGGQDVHLTLAMPACCKQVALQHHSCFTFLCVGVL
ncbi:hypothetical protein RRG08_008156 [Elysia crispata]|uniref:Uncharacterized protein n=1 Tax=Elysia crispata TaxID=231223 RepID=A0AAE0Z5C7_9GAST|nr:hypothetical protein RRG08_008156 [Elysia crispata]